MKTKNLRHALLTTALLLASPWGMAQEVVEVEIKDYQFIPAEITIRKGTTVRWINQEKRQYHSIWFEESGEKEGEYFWPDESDERTFSNTGQFNYHCGPHPKMRGSVVVTD